MAKELNSGQKAGIGMWVTAVVFGIVGTFMFFGEAIPVAVPILMGAVEVLLLGFGIYTFVKPDLS